MKKIVLSTAGAVGISLCQGHINWLKNHGVVLIPNPAADETEFRIYQVWANNNRENSLLIRCLEELHDKVDAAMAEERELFERKDKASRNAQYYIRLVAENIIKKKGRGHISVDIVAAWIRAGKTFEDILNSFSQDYRHLNRVHPTKEYAKAVKYLTEADVAKTAYQTFLDTNGIVNNGFIYNQYEIKEYDDTQFLPKVIIETSTYWKYDEEHEEMKEVLHLIPMPTHEITEVCLASFVAENDVAGLLQYLRERNVTIL